ncbi:hypothetical protein PSACC_01240 [Paramicrosporidium saccamoebae]|uniref:GPI inositol-deacylase n=1 Tax=Paramicrosporidium saccamoebae TaxID=1246581 RepID=A0A2H9TMG2_9FUNG|nr:hypothetical protein PSACC_01240 [Paramicrosporidium saccamoebae]
MPESVLVVGHSMGGIVASLGMALPQFQPGTVRNIITIVSPHFRPIVSVDRALVHAYQTVTNFWGAKDNPALRNVTLVLVPPTPRDREVSAASDFIQLAPDVVVAKVFPENWMLCPDHNGIISCHSFLLVLARIIDKLAQLEDPVARKREIAATVNLFAHRWIGERLGALTNDTLVSAPSFKGIITTFGLTGSLTSDRSVNSPHNIDSENVVESLSVGESTVPLYSFVMPQLSFGWKEYLLDITSQTNCSNATIRIAHSSSGEERWYSNTCRALIRFDTHVPGIRADLWLNATVLPVRIRVSLNFGSSMAELLRRQFQLTIAAQIVFSCLLIYAVWKGSGKALRLTVLDPWLFCMSALTLLSGKSVYCLWHYFNGTPCDPISELFFACLLAIVSNTVTIASIVLLSVSMEAFQKKSACFLHSDRAHYTGRKLVRKGPLIALIIPCILLPAPVAFLFVFALLLVTCFKLALDDEEGGSGVAKSLVPLFAFFALIEGPLALVSLKLWQSWHSLDEIDPFFILPFFGLVVIVKTEMFTLRTITQSPYSIRIYLWASLVIMCMGTAAFGNNHLYWPLRTFSALSIPLIIYSVYCAQK